MSSSRSTPAASLLDPLIWREIVIEPPPPARVPFHLARFDVPPPAPTESILRWWPEWSPADGDAVRDVADVHAAPDPIVSPPALLLSVREAAALLGISETALRSREERGQLRGTAVRTGRRLQFHRAKLLAYVDRRAK